MKQYRCLVEFSEVAAAAESKTLVEFTTDISSVDFNYQKGDVEKRSSIDAARLDSWEQVGHVIPFKDVKNAARIALTAGKLYTDAQLHGRSSELVEREIVTAHGESKKSKTATTKKS